MLETVKQGLSTKIEIILNFQSVSYVGEKANVAARQPRD
jgi:hypothetical protein